jgi:hypothetical protein
MAIPEKERKNLEKIAKEFDEALGKAVKILDERYTECDADGHKRSIINRVTLKTRCGHCYRHIDYHSTIGEDTFNERGDLPDCMQPYDAPAIMRRMQEDIRQQKFKDRMYGIGEIMKTLKRD